MINRKALLAVGACAALAALWPSGTFAADSNTPVRGTPSCHGDFVGSVSSNDLGNPAQHSKSVGTPVRELQVQIRVFCGR
jgi:hypothetical protein